MRKRVSLFSKWQHTYALTAHSHRLNKNNPHLVFSLARDTKEVIVAFFPQLSGVLLHLLDLRFQDSPNHAATYHGKVAGGYGPEVKKKRLLSIANTLDNAPEPELKGTCISTIAKQEPVHAHTRPVSLTQLTYTQFIIHHISHKKHTPTLYFFIT